MLVIVTIDNSISSSFTSNRKEVAEMLTTTPAAQRIILALDCGPERAKELTKLFAGKISWVKIGIALFCEPGMIKFFKGLGYKIFYDPKHHDTSDRVRIDISYEISRGIDMLTIHASGGEEMCRQAIIGAREGFEKRDAEDRQAPPIILAVSGLTSLDDDDCIRIYGGNRAETVLKLSNIAWDGGVNNFVTSTKEVALLYAEILGDDDITVVPGIKLAGKEANVGQKAVGTAGQAVGDGGTFVVAGSAITKADDPIAAFEQMVTEIEQEG